MWDPVPSVVSTTGLNRRIVEACGGWGCSEPLARAPPLLYVTTVRAQDKPTMSALCRALTATFVVSCLSSVCPIPAPSPRLHTNKHHLPTLLQARGANLSCKYFPSHLSFRWAFLNGSPWVTSAHFFGTLSFLRKSFEWKCSNFLPSTVITHWA